MRHAERTGAARYRIETRGWFRKRTMLVLQIEERGLDTNWSGASFDTEWVTRWRDATIKDLRLKIVPEAKNE